MDWGFVFGLVVVTMVVIVPLVYFGLKASKKLESYAEENDSELADLYVGPKLTISGSLLIGCLVGFWLCCVVARVLYPSSDFGSFVNSADGLGIAVITSIFIFVIAAEILRRIGHPFLSRDK